MAKTNASRMSSPFSSWVHWTCIGTLVQDAEMGCRRPRGVCLYADVTGHTAIRNDVSQVAALQKQIRDAELEIARIRATHPPDTVRPFHHPLVYFIFRFPPRARAGSEISSEGQSRQKSMLMNQRLTTDQANLKLDEQIEQMRELQEVSDQNTARVDNVRNEVSRTTKEVARLAREREREEARAKEVREGREAGDGKVDELCRWYVLSTFTSCVSAWWTCVSTTAALLGCCRRT